MKNDAHFVLSNNYIKIIDKCVNSQFAQSTNCDLCIFYNKDYEMYSMDFEEFLWAKGYSPEQIEEYYRHLIEVKPLSFTRMKQAPLKWIFLLGTAIH